MLRGSSRALQRRRALPPVASRPIERPQAAAAVADALPEPCALFLPSPLPSWPLVRRPWLGLGLSGPSRVTLGFCDGLRVVARVSASLTQSQRRGKEKANRPKNRRFCSAFRRLPIERLHAEKNEDAADRRRARRDRLGREFGLPKAQEPLLQDPAHLSGLRVHTAIGRRHCT